MGLTLEVEHRLKGKGFDVLYQSAPEKWIEMAANARQYCEKFIKDDQPIRPGDISENLQNAIKTDSQFETHMKVKKLTQKYFIRDFSDYILDQIYPSGIPKEAHE
jgi:hypothetical protein